MSDRSESMSNQDTAWLRMEDPTNLMMITGLMVFPGPLPRQRLLALLAERLLRFDRFRQVAVRPRRPLANPRWQSDPHFDLQAHVHWLGLPPPGDKEALAAVVSDLMSTPLDHSKPLWQLHVFEGYGAGTAAVWRLHHSIGDGIALTRVLLSLADESPEGVPAAVAEDAEEEQAAEDSYLHMAGAVARQGWRTLHQPRRLVDAASAAAGGAGRLARILTRWPDPPTIFKGELGVAKRAAWSEPLALADVKAIGRVTGATVNDVLLAAVAGALRRYLVGREQPVTDLNFRAFIPVNRRPPDAPLVLGNQFGLVFLSLPVGVEDPLDRLFALKQRMDALKASPEAAVAVGLLNLMGMAPAGVEELAISFMAAKATAVMTNVPGPRRPLYLAGQPIRSVMAWVPQSGHLGLGVGIISYNDEVMLGVSSDAGLVPDPEAIVAGFAAEFEAYMELVRQVET